MLTTSPSICALLAPDVPLVDELTRRGFLGGLAAASLLSACGDDTEAGDRATTNAPGFPRRVEHAGGTTELDEPPGRIYTFGGAPALDSLLALGALPTLYTPFQDELLPWQQIDGMADVATFAGEGDLIEALASNGVDFAMLDDGTWADQGRQVRAYCPAATPAVPYPIAGFTTLWGSVLGRDEDAADVVADYERAARDLAEPAGPSLNILVPGQGNVFVYQGGFDTTRFVEDAGFTVQRFEGQQDDFGFDLSHELLGQLAADVTIVIQPYGPGPEGEALLDLPLFQGLPSVDAGRFLALDTVDSNALLAPTRLALPTTADVLASIRSLV